jgi:GntR family transcriptional regulator
MSSWLSTRYENVFAYIEAGIRDGELAPGEKLEGERKLAERLGLSRETVRQGLDLAEQSGLIVRVPQRGTFVATPRVNQSLGEMRSFRHTMQGLSMTPAYQLRRVQEIRLDAETASRLQVPTGTKALKIEVIGTASGLPMALYVSTLPKWVADAIGDTNAWGERASYELAAAALSLESLTVSQEFEAITLRREQAQVLRTRSGMAGFQSLSIFSAPDNRPVEVRSAWYPGSRYKFAASRRIEFSD